MVGTYNVGNAPWAVAFDGANIWVPNFSDSTVTKLLASTGALVGTYSVEDGPDAVAFDGASIWVCNENSNTMSKL
jgi:DNA-binding beta-propeller fold protein YncE